MLRIMVYDFLDKAVVEISRICCTDAPRPASESGLIYRCLVGPGSAPTAEMAWIDAAIVGCQQAATDLWGEAAALDEWAGRELSDH